MTEQEMDEILKDLPTCWKKVGEKKMVENAYRYLMMHSELQNTELGIKAYKTMPAKEQLKYVAERPIEMMGLIGAGNNPMVGMTVAVAVAIEEASK